jgi:hypothetical protein
LNMGYKDMPKIVWITDIHLNFPPQPSRSTKEATGNRVSADGKGHNTIVDEQDARADYQGTEPSASQWPNSATMGVL